MTKYNDSGKYVSVKHLRRYLKASEEHGFGKCIDESDIENIENYDASTIELTRCKDCEWWWTENEVCAEDHHVIDGICGVEMPANGFCSYGEPRKGKK